MLRPLIITLIALCALASHAGQPLPAHANIQYDVFLGGNIRVGNAEQTWRLADGRYTLETRIAPIIGPKIRYLSHGRIGKQGLVPEDYAEFRNNDDKPRATTSFDWAAREASIGPDEPLQTAKLETGAQDINAFAFQLAWLGAKDALSMQIATGRKLRIDRFAPGDNTQVKLAGRDITARVWRSQDNDSHTEVWLAPELGNLPLRVQRSDDRTEIVLVARQITFDPKP